MPTRRRTRRARVKFNAVRREWNRIATLNAKPYSYDPHTVTRLYGRTIGVPLMFQAAAGWTWSAQHEAWMLEDQSGAQNDS